VGGIIDNRLSGTAWVFTRSGATWTQRGSKLVGTDTIGRARQGHSVALSADGSTAIAGGIADNRITGAAWIHSRSGGVWTQLPPRPWDSWWREAFKDGLVGGLRSKALALNDWTLQHFQRRKK
jgi:hypothetical protein